MNRDGPWADVCMYAHILWVTDNGVCELIHIQWNSNSKSNSIQATNDMAKVMNVSARARLCVNEKEEKKTRFEHD